MKIEKLFNRIKELEHYKFKNGRHRTWIEIEPFDYRFRKEGKGKLRLRLYPSEVSLIIYTQNYDICKEVFLVPGTKCYKWALAEFRKYLKLLDAVYGKVSFAKVALTKVKILLGNLLSKLGLTWSVKVFYNLQEQQPTGCIIELKGIGILL